MKKPTLEEANQHFETRHIYAVDVLDLLTSRGIDWKLDTKGPDGMRYIKTVATKSYPSMFIPQELPAYLKHSLAYIAKYIKEGKK